MPDLARYAGTVLGAYAVAIGPAHLGIPPLASLLLGVEVGAKTADGRVALDASVRRVRVQVRGPLFALDHDGATHKGDLPEVRRAFEAVVGQRLRLELDPTTGVRLEVEAQRHALVAEKTRPAGDDVLGKEIGDRKEDDERRDDGDDRGAKRRELKHSGI